jgi:hypothetical protein
MPEPLSYKQTHVNHEGMTQAVNQSIPTKALEVNERPTLEDASIFHLVRNIEQLIKGIEFLGERVDALVRDNEKQRNFVDTPTAIGLTIGYTVAYHDRKFLFIYSAPGLTLVANNGTTKTVAASTWVNISYPRGTILTVQSGSDVTPSLVTIRACDFLLSTN